MFQKDSPCQQNQGPVERMPDVSKNSLVDQFRCLFKPEERFSILTFLCLTEFLHQKAPCNNVPDCDKKQNPGDDLP